MKFHIHALPEEPGCPHSSVIALRLESCLARRCDIRLLDKIAGDWAETQRDFVNALYSPDADRTFALRFIARPDSFMVSAGRVDVVLLGKCGAKSAKQSQTASMDLGRELVALLCTHMPDYQWLPVTDAEEFTTLWNPFDDGKIQLAALRRRESMVSIHSLKSRPSLGRGRTATDLPEADAKSALYCVHPFAPRFTTFPGLMRMLLLQGGPVLFQTALRPTRLEKGEKQALHEQIGRCEQALGSNQASNPLQPAIHRNRTSSLCRLLMGQSMRVEDAPFLHHAMLASRQPLTAGMMESAGIAITRPLGGDASDANLEHATDALQIGGYDTARPTGEKDRTVAEKNLWNLEFDSWGPTLAPPSLVRLRHLLDASEAISSFQIPLATEEGLQGIEVRSARFRPMPPELASKPPVGAIGPGFNPALGQLQPVRLSEAGRRLHTYVVGQTGTGKSTLLSSMIIEDMRAGRGLAVIDPHGDLYHELLRHVPPSREKDLVLLDPCDPERVPGLNLLECESEAERHFVVREAREIIERLIMDQYGHKSSEIMGPAFFQHMQMNMLLTMSDPDKPGTLLDFYQIFQRKDQWKQWMPLRWRDPRLVSWVENNLPNVDYLKRGGDNSATWGEYLSSKFEDFVFDPLLRNIFGQHRSTIRMREIMDQGKILLVNLSKGQLAEQNARFLGYVLMARIKAAAMARADVPISQRRLFFLYVDEFQSLATSNFIPMLSESRKYGLSLVLANQFVSQITDDRIMNGIFGNVGTHICFRVGRDDAEKLESQFGPSFDRSDLANLPNWHACVRTTVDGRVTAPFTLRTNPQPATEADPQRIADLVATAKAGCTRPRAEVEEEIRRTSNPIPRTKIFNPEKPIQVIIVEKDPVILSRLLVLFQNGFCVTTNDVQDLPKCRLALNRVQVLILINDSLTHSTLRPVLPELATDCVSCVIEYNEDSSEGTGLTDGKWVTSGVLCAKGLSVQDLEASRREADYKTWVRMLVQNVHEIAGTDPHA